MPANGGSTEIMGWTTIKSIAISARFVSVSDHFSSRFTFTT